MAMQNRGGKHATAALVTALSSVLTGNLTAGVALGFIAFKVEESLIFLLARRRSMNVE
ncbi:MAG: hypothetical protein OEM19_03730 [Deltaproteobacteria bacterium]|nr:hypothetical protein [Deltaproteobacteria bacterium]